MRAALPSAVGGWPSTHVALLAWLMLVHALPYAGAAVNSDAARDLHAAWDIVQGARPLVGPLINDTLHLGPAWFYLLAVPMALGASLAATLFLAGLLAALKFPLAYALGRLVMDARLGLLLALALALPGWASWGQMLPLHIVLVETCMLAVLLALLWLYRQGPGYWWPVLGLLQSLALHAHPATLLLALLVPLVLWQRRRRWAAELGWIALGLLAASVPFLPMLAHEAATGWTGFDQLRTYGERHSSLQSMLGAPALVAGIVAAGPVLLWDNWQAHAGAFVLPALQGILMLAAAAGWVASLGDARARSRLGRAFLLAVVMALGLAALRERTPWYMALAWQPWHALLLALGWRQLSGVYRPALAVLASSAVLLALGGSAAWLVAGDRGVLGLRPQSFKNVQAWSPPARSSFLPAWRLDRLGAGLCSQPAPVVLHGDLALAYDSALGLPGRMQCGPSHTVGIGGGAALHDAIHRLGLAPWVLQELGVCVTGWSAALRLAPSAVIAAAQPVPVAHGGTDPARPRQAGQRVRQSFQFTTGASALVVVNRPFFAFDTIDVVEARANGIPIEPVHARTALLAWRCSDCPEPVEWDFVLENGRPDWLDVFVWEPPADADSQSR